MVLLSSADFFSKLIFSKILTGTYERQREYNVLDSDQDGQF